MRKRAHSTTNSPIQVIEVDNTVRHGNATTYSKRLPKPRACRSTARSALVTTPQHVPSDEPAPASIEEAVHKVLTRPVDAEEDTRRRYPITEQELAISRVQTSDLNEPELPQPYRDPELHDCQEMIQALRDKVFDVAFRGPVYLVPLVANEAAMLRGQISLSSAETAMFNRYAIGFCPFDGTRMDTQVCIHPHVVDEGAPWCCCGGMAKLIDSERVELPSDAHRGLACAKLVKPDGTFLRFGFCPFCSTSILKITLMRQLPAPSSADPVTPL